LRSTLAVLGFNHVSGFLSLRSTRYSATAAISSLNSLGDDHNGVVGSVYRVMGVEYREGMFANLKVFKEPGDPYGEVVSHLRHSDEIVSTGFKNYAGQSWVQHTVDESKQGLYKGETPKPPYVGWSSQDIGGWRWLQCLDVVKVNGLSKQGLDASEMLGEANFPDGYDNENVFAKITRGEVPSNKVFETEHAFAILDAYPVARFHCLLLPKTPSVDVSDLSVDAAAGFLKELPRLVKAVRLAAGPTCSGVNVLSNVGAGAGQEVMHTHVHVVPCFEDGDGKESGAAGDSADEAAAQLKALQEFL